MGKAKSEGEKKKSKEKCQRKCKAKKVKFRGRRKCNKKGRRGRRYSGSGRERQSTVTKRKVELKVEKGKRAW